MDAISDCLTDWMRRQRWYAAKGRLPDLTEIGSWNLASDEDGVTPRVLLMLDSGGPDPLLYQVPVTVRTTIPRGWGHHLIGRIGDGAYLFDGPHDPAFARAMLRLIADGATADGGAAAAQGHPAEPALDLRGAEITSEVLSGEQSNTSIVLKVTRDGETQTVICKVFRTLHHGENPDVVLQSALSEAGSPHVPASVGHVTGEWDDSGRADGRARGHVAFAQEFLPGVQDAWRVALASAGHGDDFAERASALGEATAAVHETLAEALPTRSPSLGDVVQMVSVWHSRLAQAVAEVPEIAAHRAAIESVYDAAQQVEWPRLQRIHGDYHLGQVLWVPDRGGWVLLDFEGEPLRPMTERDQPDVPLRDVAGMLRSFDYVAGSVAAGGSDPAAAGRAAEWARAARDAFLDGYARRSGADLKAQRLLLDAFELDKAVYEAIYEKRNRPDWLPIPVTAVARLAERGLAETSA